MKTDIKTDDAPAFTATDAARIVGLCAKVKGAIHSSWNGGLSETVEGYDNAGRSFSIDVAFMGSKGTKAAKEAIAALKASTGTTGAGIAGAYVIHLSGSYCRFGRTSDRVKHEIEANGLTAADLGIKF